MILILVFRRMAMTNCLFECLDTEGYLKMKRDNPSVFSLKLSKFASYLVLIKLAK